MAEDTDHPDQPCESSKLLAFLDNERNIFKGFGKSSEDKYIPRSSLSRYFTDEGGSIESLLEEVLKDEEHAPQAETVLNQYLVVFAILLSIGKGQYLSRCIERDYSDDKLPFFDRPRHFPKSEEGSFFDSFSDAQWRFCPVRINKNPVNFQIEPEQILPLRRREQISRNESSTTYLVEFHEEYDSLSEDSAIFEIDLGIGKPTSHTYLFKEFSKISKPAYDKELTGYLYLQKSGQLLGKTVTGFYGSFVHDDSFTIILEHADHGTLDIFMSTIPPPTSGEDITRVWESILRLHEGLHTMHNMSAPYSAEVLQHTSLRGWHQSLSSRHISVISGETGSDYDCQFRIANIGTLDEVEAAKPYAAPECSNIQSDTNLQMADVFSLGCIISEFAVWITTGLSGLHDYRNDRKREAEDRDLRNATAFHDGQNLLQSVTYWNNTAVESRVNEDKITEAVIQQVVEEMICEDADARPTTRQLKAKINKILTRAREQYMADLRRNDSAASNSTGYSSMGLSSQSRLSYRTSVRSDSSGDTPLGYNSSVRSHLGRSATVRSTASSRMSPSVIDEDQEAFFVSTNVSHLMNPVSPMGSLRSRNPARIDQTLNGSDAPEPMPLRLGGRTSTMMTASMSPALLNGEDKEIVVTRGPPPVNLRSVIPGSPTMATEARSEPASTLPEVVATQGEARSVTGNQSMRNEEPTRGIPAYTPMAIRPDHDPHAVTPPAYTSMDIRPDHDPEATTSSTSARPDPDLTRSQTTTGLLNASTQNELRPEGAFQRSLSSPGLPGLVSTQVRSVTKPVVYKPSLNLIDGLIWLNSKKLSASGASLRDESYLSQIADRDFVFLIDDSGSMRRHREMSSRCVRLMAWLLKKHDKGGMDLYFTNKPGKTHTRPGHSSDLQRPILQALDVSRGKSDINSRLTQILGEYRDRSAAGSVSQTSGRASIASFSSTKTITGTKKLMIYVISDGEWQARSEEKLVNTMDAVATSLKAQGAPDGAVAMQWIRTVEDNKGRFEKLKAGRRDLEGKIVVDTVDLESNVFRSLLGPIVDLWDSGEDN